MLNDLLNWLLNEENRKLVTWLGGGLVTIIGGLWTLYTYLYKSPEKSTPAPAPITTGDIHSGGDVVVGPGTIDKRTYNYAGLTDIEVAKQLGVAEAAVKNFLKILDQQHVPIAEWDNTLRQLAERYQELQKRAALLAADDPAVRSLQDQARQAIDVADFARAEALLAKAVELDNAAAEKFKESYRKRKRSAAESQALQAKSLHTRFALPQAIDSYQQAIALAKQGEDTNQVADFQWSMGMVYADNASFDQAIASYENALHHYMALEGEESINVAALRNNLGVAWADKGQYDQAIEYYEKALAVDRKVFGDEHPKVAGDWNNLGNAWAEKGHYDQAIEYYDKALAVDRRAFGDEHPEVATDWNNLGAAWAEKGDYDQAIEYYGKALAVDRKAFGDEHPKIAGNWNNLGAAWADKGEYDQAIAYFDKALVVDRKAFGEDHPNVAGEWNNLGRAWAAKGEYDQAIVYYDKALAVWNDKLGPDHPHTKMAKDNIEKARQKLAEQGNK